MKDLLYPEVKERISKTLNKIENSDGIISANKKHISDFVQACYAKGLSDNRVNIYLQRLYTMAKFFKDDFQNLQRADIDGFFASLPRDRSPWTRDAYVVTLQNLYRFLFGLTSRDQLPEVIRHVPRSKGRNTMNSEDLLTDAEIERMMRAAKTLRWRAIIGTLADTGLRPGELRGIMLGDVTLKHDTAKIKVSEGKMKGRAGPRDVFVIQHFHALKEWMLNHPAYGNPEAWFIDEDGKPMSHKSLDIGLKRIAKSAGVRKKLTSYLFRHTAATRIYKSMPTEMARRILGHEAGSSMSAVYTHIGSDELEDMMFKVMGKSRRKFAAEDIVSAFERFLEKHPEFEAQMLKEIETDMEKEKPIR